ncbi:MAG TPA: carboxylating nicotinate-nucleotide diphosphorylase [Myxococcota bacterium]|nr:carboxylating nicotinate-nucleotide diphosphorylase [Myxococcota bacterium]
MLSLPPRATWLWLVEAALAEDLGPGDATSLAVLRPGDRGVAVLEARAEIVVSGLEVAREVFAQRGVACELVAADGEVVQSKAPLAHVRGAAIGILEAERTALNFVQRLSGIATLTRRFCQEVRGTRAEIVDTRKTTPGFRTLEKYAVRCGGGRNHRTALYDGILIKDNHIAAVGSVAAAVARARERGSRHLRVRVEVESLAQAREALDAGADALLVDNQPPAAICAIVAEARGRARVEASGGVTLESVGAIARTGVDEISVGALTHSAPAADVALEWTARSSS